MTPNIPQPYVITVEFEIEPEAASDFMALMLENAEESLRSEPGCLRFDVLTPLSAQAENRVFLYEIYTDRGAFQQHLASAHFKTFDAATMSMVRAKSVTQYAIRQNAGPGT